MESVAEVMLREVVGDGGWETLPAETKRMMSDNGYAILAELRGGELELDPSALAAIPQPTLLVTAAESLPAFQEMWAAMAKALPTARTVQVAGNHMIDPAEPAVLDFIREVLAGVPVPTGR